MDKMLARTMIETLAKGIDPLSGWILPDSDICSQEEVQEALRIVLAHCSIESTEQYLHSLKSNSKSTRYSRAGSSWTKKEDQELKRMYQQGYRISKISLILKRTPGAIESRLRRLDRTPYYQSKK